MFEENKFVSHILKAVLLFTQLHLANIDTRAKKTFSELQTGVISFQELYIMVGGFFVTLRLTTNISKVFLHFRSLILVTSSVLKSKIYILKKSKG